MRNLKELFIGNNKVEFMKEFAIKLTNTTFQEREMIGLQFYNMFNDLKKKSKTEYKHSLNKVLVSGLRKLYDKEKPTRLDDLKLNLSQSNNFQKLKYFGLVYQTGDNYKWGITELGIDFIRGNKSVHKRITTKSNMVVAKSQQKIFVGDVKEFIEYKDEWKSQNTTRELF